MSSKYRKKKKIEQEREIKKTKMSILTSFFHVYVSQEEQNQRNPSQSALVPRTDP